MLLVSKRLVEQSGKDTFGGFAGILVGDSGCHDAEEWRDAHPTAIKMLDSVTFLILYV